MSVPTTSPQTVPEFTLPRLPSGKVDVAAWAKHLGIAPIHDLKELAGGVWPDDEPVDEFQAARRGWHGEGQH